jgi:hypothetical protein
VGTAKRPPLSRIPRRFIRAMKPMASNVRATLWPERAGTAAVMAATPEETDTATVRM